MMAYRAQPSRTRGWRTAMGFVHIDHVGIVAYTIEQAQEVLGDAFGLERVR